MKSHKRILIAAMCLLTAAVAAIVLKVRPVAVHAATPARVNAAMSIKPAVHLSDAAVRTALVSNAMMLDEESALRVSGTQTKKTIFPPVQEFTLTPPNPAAGLTKTVLSVRFPEAKAASLPSSIPTTLANQNVILQRSPDQPGTFLAALDFNWSLFAEEQAERKEAANQGKMVPIFEGRKYRGLEKMQFVDPEQIRQALASHQALQFGSHALVGSAGFNVFPDHQLIMTNKLVVEDASRTFDGCITDGSQGTATGAWTFNTLMTAIACSGNSACTNSQTSQQIAEKMLLGMLNNFAQDQSVNSFTVFARPQIGNLNDLSGQNGSGLLDNWPIDASAQTSCTFNNSPSTCPSLPNAPVRLDAIVNRIDVGANGDPFAPAGELRFVFSLTASSQTNGGSCSNSGRGQTFNIILEYKVPSTFTPLAWAQRWAGLRDLNAGGNFSPTYLSDLQTNVTDAVVKAGKCANSTSCISQIRTNEILLTGGGTNPGFWEQREFHLDHVAGAPVLTEGTIAQTPDPQFNTLGSPQCNKVNDPNRQNNGPCHPGIAADYINTEANDPVFQHSQGAAPPIQNDFDGIAFLGGSALNMDTTGSIAPAFWNDSIINSMNGTARIDFSFNTCNGCHGKETATGFVHVSSRAVHSRSALSNFLLGNQTPQCAIETENLGSGSTGTCRESVTDPTGQAGPTLFGDVARRVLFLQNVCGNSPTCTPGASNELLFPFINNPIGVH